MNEIINVNDSLNSGDRLAFEIPKTGLYTRTKIIGGYDPYKDERGFTCFGEKVFETSNMIVLGGSLFTLEKIFGISSPLTIAYLNDIMGVADEGNDTTPNPADNIVCLFGVGIGGAGETISDVYDVKYYEREIIDMIPLRQTADTLTSTEQAMYWFKKPIVVDGATKTQYYLKRFEVDPEIHVLWRDAEGDEDGSSVTDGVHNTPPNNTTPIDTFVELTLKISKKDVREYFTDFGSTEVARINTIGLFTGVKEVIDTNTREEEYRHVKLFSKLNINNEIMTLAKDLTIIYRIYTS